MLKNLTALLLSVCLAQSASPIIQTPSRGVVTAAAANITVDVWQWFEFASITTGNLSAQDHAGLTWTYTDTGSNMSVSTSAQHTMNTTVNTLTDTGTRGIISDVTTGHTAARYMYATISKGASPVSVGCWVYINGPSIGSGIAQAPIMFMYGGGSVTAAISIGTSGTTPIAFIEAAAPSSGITLAVNTWYWFTAKIQQNSTCTLAVYNAAGVQVGSNVTCSARNDTSSLFVIGNFNPYGAINVQYYYDNLVIDYTTATFPILQ